MLESHSMGLTEIRVFTQPATESDKAKLGRVARVMALSRISVSMDSPVPDE